jgi:undecaprenyl-diphosphatase
MTVTGGLEADRAAGFWRQVQSNLAAGIAPLRRPARLGPCGLRLWSGRVAIGAAATLVVLAAVVMLVDAAAITSARTWPPTVYRFFHAITGFGQSGWLLWPLGVTLALLTLAVSPRLGRIGMLVVTACAVRLTFVFMAVAVPGLVATLAKRLIGRARPFVGGTADPYLYDPFAWKAAYASLPSGHTTTAFAAAVAIGAVWPQARPWLWAYAVVIAVSRVAIWAHHPSDVLAGAVVGAVGAILVRDWFAARRLAFAVALDGRIQAMPGPSLRRLKKVAARFARP